MDGIKSNALLKASARKSLNGNYQTAIIVVILASLLSSAISGMMPTINLSSTVNIISCIFILYLSSFISYILKAGMLRSFINIYCKQPAGPRDLMYFFTAKNKASFSFSACLMAVLYVLYMPAIFYLIKNVSNLKNADVLMKLAILAIGGLLVFYYVYLNVSQVLFLLSDFPDKSAKELVKLSIWMMKGSKKRFMYLQLSLLPYMFLGLITFGIGMIWVKPYVYASYTAFYLNLSNAKSS